MRLIDADSLKDAIEIERRYLIAREMVGAEHGLVHHVIPLVDDAPTIDAVPVVWCKNCKHRYITGSTTHYYVCDFMDAEYNDNGYCHHGERKDDDN